MVLACLFSRAVGLNYKILSAASYVGAQSELGHIRLLMAELARNGVNLEVGYAQHCVDCQLITTAAEPFSLPVDTE